MRFYNAKRKDKKEILVSYDGGEKLYSLNSLGFSYADMNQLICESMDGQLDDIRRMETKLDGKPFMQLCDVKLSAPVEYPLQDIICLGVNYDEHAAEAVKFSREAFELERSYMTYFSKRVNRASGPNEPIPSYPDLVDSLDYEVELAVVIGKTAKTISRADAKKYIFGYTIINDVSARNLQTRHNQWYLGKSLDGFTPMGPCIVTPDELGDDTDLDIICRVNGETRQNSNTKYMIQNVDNAIEELSRAMTLKAGTIIATGTPAGVGMGMVPPRFLKKGDIVECEIRGIGILNNPVL